MLIPQSFLDEINNRAENMVTIHKEHADDASYLEDCDDLDVYVNTKLNKYARLSAHVLGETLPVLCNICLVMMDGDGVVLYNEYVARVVALPTTQEELINLINKETTTDFIEAVSWAERKLQQKQFAINDARRLFALPDLE
jgi:hypothetical protein